MAYDASDGLCLRHLHLAMERGRTPPSLVEHTLRKWDTVPFTEAETRAVRLRRA